MQFQIANLIRTYPCSIAVSEMRRILSTDASPHVKQWIHPIIISTHFAQNRLMARIFDQWREYASFVKAVLFGLHVKLL